MHKQLVFGWLGSVCCRGIHSIYDTFGPELDPIFLLSRPSQRTKKMLLRRSQLSISGQEQRHDRPQASDRRRHGDGPRGRDSLGNCKSELRKRKKHSNAFLLGVPSFTYRTTRHIRQSDPDLSPIISMTLPCRRNKCRVSKKLWIALQPSGKECTYP